MLELKYCVDRQELGLVLRALGDRVVSLHASLQRTPDLVTELRAVSALRLRLMKAVAKEYTSTKWPATGR